MTSSDIESNSDKKDRSSVFPQRVEPDPMAATPSGTIAQLTRAACTIVSFNYLHYARVLAASFRRFHPEYRFYVLLVDRLPQGFQQSTDTFELIEVEQLGIQDFESIAFRFGILELNTNVKPSFLAHLLEQGNDQIIYFDPDIFLYSSASSIFDLLTSFDIILTPHCLSPNVDAPYSEVLLLVNGVFNLGFIAVRRSTETFRFLAWWERRCLTLGFDERWSGLFVDQKWINLAPCYFDFVHVLKDPGCNTAYWNLHERSLTREQGRWIVNNERPLIFFHFSGISLDGNDQISRHTEQFDLTSRTDLVELFSDYRRNLKQSISPVPVEHRYAYGFYSNGVPINKLQRAIFAANREKFETANPFDAEGPFYSWARGKGLHSTRDSVASYGRKAYNRNDTRVRLINYLLRVALRVLGADRYTILMRYLEFASVLRNQKDILR